MDFGPRWGNVRQIRFRRTEALLSLELPAAFSSDLDTFALHPALLDMATGGAQPLLPGFDSSRDFYVPFSYGRLVLWKALPPRLYSHVRLQDAKTQGLAVFNITLADEAGTVVAEVSDFIMKHVADLVTDPVRERSRSALPISSATTLAGQMLRHGIAPAEGIQAFERILAGGLAPRLSFRPWTPITGSSRQACLPREAAVGQQTQRLPQGVRWRLRQRLGMGPPRGMRLSGA